MTRYDALKIRGFLNWLFNKEEESYLHAEIAKTYPHIDADDWTVYIYANQKESSFLVDAALLCNALVVNCCSYRAAIGHYDAGTIEPDVRCAAILR